MPTLPTKLVDDSVAQLVEHFDSVLILVSLNADGRTRAYFKRGGNYYAAKGMAQEFLDDEHNKDTADAIAGALRPLD